MSGIRVVGFCGYCNRTGACEHVQPRVYEGQALPARDQFEVIALTTIGVLIFLIGVLIGWAA